MQHDLASCRPVEHGVGCSHRPRTALSEAVFHCRAEEVPEGTIAWIGDEGFLLRPDNTLLHLNGPAAELGVTWAAGKSQRGGVTSP